MEKLEKDFSLFKSEISFNSNPLCSLKSENLGATKQSFRCLLLFREDADRKFGGYSGDQTSIPKNRTKKSVCDHDLFQ